MAKPDALQDKDSINMPRLAANLSMLYTEHLFLERFAAAAASGFRGVEFLFPYAHPAGDVADRLGEAALEVVLFNVPPGDWEAGERGLASLPGRESEFLDGMALAIDYARILSCPRIHVMAGLIAEDGDRNAHREVYLRNLAEAANLCAAHDITALIEPLNPRDVPGYLLSTQEEAYSIVEEVGAANLMIQMDLYHCQIVEGDLATKIDRYIDRIGHFQIAGVPGRHEPDHGEVAYPWLFSLIDDAGYSGWIGCEYRPQAETEAGLGWARPWGIGP